MNTSLRFWLLSAVGMTAAAMVTFAVFASAPSNSDEMRKTMNEAFQQGNFKDAYEGYHSLLLDPQADPRQVRNDLIMAIQCLERLNRIAETDALLEDVAKIHKDQWRALAAVAQGYMSGQDGGFIIAGKFSRGQHRGGGKFVNCNERDRVRALQLMVQAMPLALKDDNHADVGEFLLSLANALLNNRGYGESWRLQYLTDLSTLPDYTEGWGYGRQSPGAPVDVDGKPVFHHVPKSFESAKTDGERWRWCLQQAAEMNPQMLNSVRMQLAEFLESQFGVQTLAQWGWQFGRMATDDTKDESGIYALHTLKENETIAKLASGIKRFDLPDEFNYLKLYQKIAFQRDEQSLGATPDLEIQALIHLANIFENRRQYPKAAEYWQRLLKNSPSHDQRDAWKAQLNQIVGNWGRFEQTETQPAGRGAKIGYRFRNGNEVSFIAREINVKQLLDDVKRNLESRPKDLKLDSLRIDAIAWELLDGHYKKYVGREVANW